MRTPMGPKKLAVLTGDRINEGLFYKKMYQWSFCRAAKTRGRNNEVAVRRGSTVVCIASVVAR